MMDKSIIMSIARGQADGEGDNKGSHARGSVKRRFMWGREGWGNSGRAWLRRRWRGHWLLARRSARRQREEEAECQQTGDDGDDDQHQMMAELGRFTRFGGSGLIITRRHETQDENEGDGEDDAGNRD